MKKISIIIPTYKPREYIWECLNSIKNQTFTKELYEVLIILNGSEESYFDKINKYILENQLSNFILIYTEKQGVSNARNIGLDIMKGEYVVFLDDDDYLSNNYLENCSKKINKRTIVVTNNIAFDDKNGKELVKEKLWINFFNQKITNIIKVRRIFSNVCMKMIPKNIVDKTRFDIELKNGEDSLFMLEISNKIKYIEILDKKTIYYRRVRKDSAHYGNKTIIEITKNTIIQLQKYIKLLIKKEYSQKFVFLRILAILKGTIILLKFKIKEELYIIYSNLLKLKNNK